MQATAIKPKNKVERFTEYLENNLTKQQYDNLSYLLGYSTTNRISRLINPSLDNLSQFNANEVAILANELSKNTEHPVTPQDLILEWGLGVKVITLDEANALVQEQGLELGFQYAA